MPEEKHQDETDEEHPPVTERDEDAFMLEVARLLALDDQEKGPFDPNQFAGTFDIGEDPVEWQRRTRGEWERDER